MSDLQKMEECGGIISEFGANWYAYLNGFNTSDGPAPNLIVLLIIFSCILIYWRKKWN